MSQAIENSMCREDAVQIVIKAFCPTISNEYLERLVPKVIESVARLPKPSNGQAFRSLGNAILSCLQPLPIEGAPEEVTTALSSFSEREIEILTNNVGIFTDICALANCNMNTNLKCGRCLSTYYCSKEHQRIDWPRHKHACMPFSGNN